MWEKLRNLGIAVSAHKIKASRNLRFQVIRTAYCQSTQENGNQTPADLITPRGVEPSERHMKVTSHSFTFFINL